MDLGTIITISIALGMDCFAVCIAAGTIVREGRVRTALIIAALFGIFQAGMTLIGWGGGTFIAEWINSFDHWLAAGLLAIVGGKMIQEGLSGDHDGREKSFSTLSMLLVLAIATSIDALAVGISFAVLDTDIIIPSLIIGIGSIVMSLAGFWIGDRFGNLIGSRAEILGGIILILIGLRIVFEHTIGQ